MPSTSLFRASFLGALLFLGCGGTSFTSEDSGSGANGGSGASGGSGAQGGSGASGGSGAQGGSGASGGASGDAGSSTGGSGGRGGSSTGGTAGRGGSGTGGSAATGGAEGGASGSGATAGIGGTAGRGGSSGAGGSTGGAGQSGAGGDAGAGMSGSAGNAGTGGCGPCPFVACLPPVYAIVTADPDSQARPIQDLRVESPDFDVQCYPAGSSPCQWSCSAPSFNVASGSHEMTFSAPGFEPQTITFDVTGSGMCGCCACGCSSGFQGTVVLKANSEEPGACCANTLTDPTNCGSCGNDCNGAACTNGVCG